MYDARGNWVLEDEFINPYIDHNARYSTRRKENKMASTNQSEAQKAFMMKPMAGESTEEFKKRLIATMKKIAQSTDSKEPKG